MKDFRSLMVWQKAHQVTLAVYRVTSTFPKEELYGLTNQMRRSSASVPTNIAEGCGREGDSELARFFQIAMASASELEYQLLLAHDLGFIEQTTYTQLNNDLTEVRKMLNAFLQRLRAKP
ncbi:MAG: four helix bundle protein [bacterium]|nr:four helix bundle protein [bacterium]